MSGGLLEVQPHTVTVLADTLLRSQQLDATASRETKQRAEQALKTAPSPADYARLKAELELDVALLRSIEQLRTRHRPR